MTDNASNVMEPARGGTLIRKLGVPSFSGGKRRELGPMEKGFDDAMGGLAALMLTRARNFGPF